MSWSFSSNSGNAISSFTTSISSGVVSVYNGAMSLFGLVQQDQRRVDINDSLKSASTSSSSSSQRLTVRNFGPQLTEPDFPSQASLKKPNDQDQAIKMAIDATAKATDASILALNSVTNSKFQPREGTRSPTAPRLQEPSKPPAPSSMEVYDSYSIVYGSNSSPAFSKSQTFSGKSRSGSRGSDHDSVIGLVDNGLNKARGELSGGRPSGEKSSSDRSISSSSTTTPSSSKKSIASTRSSSNYIPIPLSGGGDFKSYTSSSADIGDGNKLNFCFDNKGYFHMYKTDYQGNITDYANQSPIIDPNMSHKAIENIKSALIEIRDKFPHPSPTESRAQIGKNSNINSRFSDFLHALNNFLQASNNFQNDKSNGVDLTSLSFKHANFITAQQNDEDVARRFYKRRDLARHDMQYNGPISLSISNSRGQDSQSQNSWSWYHGGDVPLTAQMMGSGASGRDEYMNRLFRATDRSMFEQTQEQRMDSSMVEKHPTNVITPSSAAQLNRSMRFQYSNPDHSLQVDTAAAAARSNSLLDRSR